MKEKERDFLLTPGVWMGEGEIELSAINEVFPFFTRWTAIKGGIEDLFVVQEIEMKGQAEVLRNQFTVSNIGHEKFDIELENEAWGKVLGYGLLDEAFIGWEFALAHLGFEGYEYYQKQEDASYFMYGEYANHEEMKTTVQGVIYRKEGDR